VQLVHGLVRRVSGGAAEIFSCHEDDIRIVHSARLLVFCVLRSDIQHPSAVGVAFIHLNGHLLAAVVACPADYTAHVAVP
jgi:hypothetical protein